MRKEVEKFVSDCRVYQVLKEIATNAGLYMHATSYFEGTIDHCEHGTLCWGYQRLNEVIIPSLLRLINFLRWFISFL